MLVKVSLFVLAEVSTDLQQLGRRLPSGYQLEGSNLPSTFTYTPPHVRRNDRTHANWQYKDIFLSAKSSQYDCKWHALVWDDHSSTTNLLSFNGLYASTLRPLQASCWCFAMTSACKYLQLTQTKFWASSTLVCGKIRLACSSSGEVHVKYWQTQFFCGDLWATKNVPHNLPARLARKGVTGA